MDIRAHKCFISCLILSPRYTIRRIY